MSPISAASTSAFINYEGNWDRVDGLRRVSNGEGASFTLPFRGSSFTVHGKMDTPNSDPTTVTNSVNITIDGGEPLRFFNTDGALFHNSTLNSSMVHSAKVQVVSGRFSFERATWESGDNYTGSQTIQVGTSLGYTTQGIWAQTPAGGASQACTGDPNSNITFNFRGNSIVIQGLGETPFAPNGIMFSALVDKKPMEQSMTVYQFNDFIQYRNDSLDAGNHTVTLTTQAADMQGSQFCVSQALIYNSTALPPPSGSNETSSTVASASPTSTSPLDVIPSKPLSGGQIGGIVVGAFLVPSLILGFLFFLWRRRRNRSLLDPRRQFAMAKHVSYERICSSCSKPITDDYRLECAEYVISSSRGRRLAHTTVNVLDLQVEHTIKR